MDKNYISTLLEEIKKINKKNQEQYQKNRKESSFNIFQIERIDRKEVKMCRFLGAILDPDAGHGRGNEFLISFVKDVLNYNDFEEKISQNVECSVVCEELIDESRRIDLVIKGRGIYIPIEAKIGAGDEYRQCTDYLTYAKNKIPNAKLFYLTTNGRRPSEKSVDGLDKDQKNNDIIPISWQDISNWCEKWQKNLLAERECDLAFCFKQYRYAINNFIKNVDLEEIMINDLCKDADTLKAAAKIYEHYNDAKIVILKSFFEELKAKLAVKVKEIDGQGLLVDGAVSFWDIDKQISDFYKHQKSTYPGVSYIFKKEKIKENVRNVIGEDYDLAIRIEVDNNLFIGICFPHLKKEEPKYENIGLPIGWSNIKDNIETINESIAFQNAEDKDNWWIGWKYIKFKDINKTINFKSDDINNNEVYFSLCDTERRSTLVEECCNEFEKVYNCCKTLLYI